MDLSFLENHLYELTENMRFQGYSNHAIEECNRVTRQIIMLAKNNEFETINDAWNIYLQKHSTLSKFTLESRHSSLQIALRFALYSEFPVHQLSQAQLKLSIHSKGKLDLYSLQCKMNKFLSLLEEEGYKVGKRSKLRTAIGRIIVMARTIEWNTFQDIRNWYDEQNMSSAYKTSVKEAINKMELFWETGKICSHPSIKRKLSYTVSSIGILDLTFWQNHLSELLIYMEEKGYGADYRKKVSNIANRITVLSRSIAWDSYEEIWHWYKSEVTGKQYLQDIRSVLGILSDFHINGIMPNNRATQNPLCLRDNNYSHLFSQYKELVDYAIKCEKERGLKESSIMNTKGAASSFFMHLQKRGYSSLSDVIEKVVLDYFFADGKEIRGYTTLSRLRSFFRKCCEICEPCKTILAYLPNLRRVRKNIQYLTAEEFGKFKSTIFDYTNSLTYKDRAIGGFLIYTPMRSSDITSLTLDAFNLQNNTFSFVQKKTSNAVILPFNVNLGNLVYDYCVNERADIKSNKLFLSDAPPYNPLGEGGIDWAVSKIMLAAGIRQNHGDRKGTHIFRHRGATTMAQNNIPAPVISAAMGHESPKSLSAYLSADFKHLKICALGLNAFSLSEEVFSDV